MSLTVTRDDQTLIVQGRLDLHSVPDLAAHRDEWRGVQRLDLQALDSVDSAGLAWLLELETQQRQPQGAALAWCHCPASLRRLMALYDLGLDGEQLRSSTDIEEKSDGSERD
ncbi:STAS domain-containing protein [Ferrimonas pelagia]|uniref:STAS domain-containing protein n=1 Tax=Ferrimonas pelagia TaxID=1177826 RepID=A0ABP9FGI3_9GAMM